jgi:hypothetical protein
MLHALELVNVGAICASAEYWLPFWSPRYTGQSTCVGPPEGATAV